MSSIRSFVKKGERQPTSGMIGLFGLKLFEELAKLGREAELRQELLVLNSQFLIIGAGWQWG